MNEPGKEIFSPRALCDTAHPLYGLSGLREIMETFVLTTMGTFGIPQGFTILIDKASNVQIVSRGLEDADIKTIQDNIPEIVQRYFSPLHPRDGLPYIEAHLILDEASMHLPCWPAQTEVLILWGIEKDCCGVAGFGKKIVDESYSQRDIQLFTLLTNDLIGSLTRERSEEIIREMRSILESRDMEIEDILRQEEFTRRDLDRRVHYLKTLYDTTLELGGLTETKKIMDTFLLMIMGTFSVVQGYILLLDKAAKTAHITYRGVDKERLRDLSESGVEKAVRRYLNTVGEKTPSSMKSQVITDMRFLGDAALTDAGAGSFFVIDEANLGLIGLGNKITGEGYSEEDQELLQTLTNNFMTFLKNAKAFEMIKELNIRLEERNIQLKKTLEELMTSRHRIEILERAKARVTSVIQRERARTRRLSVVDLLLILGFGLILGLTFNFSNPDGISIVPQTWSHEATPRIDTHWAKLKYDTGTSLFVDARPADFFNQRHIRGAVNIPLPLFDFVYMMKYNKLDPEKEIIVYGRNVSKHYDEEVAMKLAARGHKKVKILSGGLSVWQENVYPVEP
ncbi:MAG: rhodanese-like domain-containing protein [Proteobacteria bacterium]|nr:rhodanese-like domain-containing protein [Pseudomonadota bacterium]